VDWLESLSKEIATTAEVVEPLPPMQRNAQLAWIWENPLFATLLKGALKSLKYVAIFTFDFKLAGITQMLESWVLEKEQEWEREQERRRTETDQPSGFRI